jgi:rhodanese-related sulfurtransferase
MTEQHFFTGARRSNTPTEREVTVAEFLAQRAYPNAQVIDVREPEEWATGHIPGSVLMPMDDVGFRARELDPTAPVITVCRSGRRSLIIADALLAAGFSDVKSLAGGVKAWAEAGHPLES